MEKKIIKSAIEKINILLNDIEKDAQIERETGKRSFTAELFAIRVKEIKEILKGDYYDRTRN